MEKHWHPSPPPQNEAAPTILPGLFRRIQEVNTPCTCDMHAPELYKTCQHPHQSLANVTTTMKTLAIKSTPEPPTYKVEALTLAQAAIVSFSVPEEEMTPLQQRALVRFRSLKLSKFGWQHGAKALAAADVKYVLQIFNDLFFFGTLKLMFSWNKLTDPELEAKGVRLEARCHPNGHIEMESMLVAWHIGPGDYAPRKLMRLMALLHETIHAFFFQYACEECTAFHVNVVNAKLHGRAFQMLGKALWENSERLLGIKLQDSAFNSFLFNWDGVYNWPSVHDAELWGWISETD